jgi:DNA-directed RNA polymerase subunit RPC12/RpoP
MSSIHRCPGCGRALRVRQEKVGKVVACPACGARSRVSGDASAIQSSVRGGSDAGGVPALPGGLRSASKKKSKSAKTMQPFLRRWFTACGAVLGIAAVLGFAGLFWEPPALAASFICVVAILVCALAGTIWMVVDFGRRSVPLGIAVFLLPPIGLGLAFRDKGPARRGATVYASAIAPLLLLGLMLLAFLPRYTSEGRRAADANRWENLIRRMDDQLQPDTPTVSVTYSVSSQPGGLEGLEPIAESALSQFRCYVRGSFKADASARTISYAYRGRENFDGLFAFYLSSETGTFFPQQRLNAGGAPAETGVQPGLPETPAASVAPGLPSQ